MSCEVALLPFPANADFGTLLIDFEYSSNIDDIVKFIEIVYNFKRVKNYSNSIYEEGAGLYFS